MKHLKKVWHTSIDDNKDPKFKLNTQPRAFRAMQNTTTGDTPEVLHYGANVHTNMPNLRNNRVDNGHQGGQEEGTKKRDAKEKDPTPYNPHHYTQIHGTQIQVEQGLEERRRVTKKWNKVDCRIQQN